MKYRDKTETITVSIVYWWLLGDSCDTEMPFRRPYLEHYWRDTKSGKLASKHLRRTLCFKTYDEAIVWLTNKKLGLSDDVHMNNKVWVPTLLTYKKWERGKGTTITKQRLHDG